MQTRVSSKGQVVIPSRIRRKLDLRTGDALQAGLEGRRIVLTPQRTQARGARIVRDPITGLPALTAGPKARKLTSAQVRELLADFP